MSVAAERNCPDCGLAQTASPLKYRWRCPGCMTPLRLASIKPFAVTFAVGGILGALAPTASWPLTVYLLVGAAILIVLERSLVRREPIERDRSQAHDVGAKRTYRSFHPFEFNHCKCQPDQQQREHHGAHNEQIERH
jgi:hypothetical protein